ncbi:MAG: acetate--CoA ligase family protein [Pseudomonadota bacterium]
MDLHRLLNPKSIAFFGGQWASIAADQCRRLGFAGSIWQVNPKRAAAGEPGFFADVASLPEAPDAAFVAVSRAATVELLPELRARDVGGLVCFASGFEEVGDEEARSLSDRLLRDSGDLPFIGPNCYGFINFFDRASLWPDEIAYRPAEKGVAFISQSGTITITVAHNRRSLPLGYAISAGNQTQVTVDDLMLHMAADDRITAIGLYLEGIKDPERFIETVEQVRAAGKPIALVKAGRTEAAAQAALTHTGSLSGSDAVFNALCERLGIARCETLAELCETLKLFHQAGPLAGDKVLVLGASGGDMVMAADKAAGTGLDLAPLPPATEGDLRTLYGDRVVYSNPFDTHIYSWYDHEALAYQFRALSAAGYDALAYMLDVPDPAECDPAAFVEAIKIYLRETKRSGQVACLLSSLPETIPEPVRELMLEAGATPLQGLGEGLFALDAAARIGVSWRAGGTVRLVPGTSDGRLLSEAEGKGILKGAGLPVPDGRITSPLQAVSLATEIGFPVALKISAASVAHKTEAGGVFLNLPDEAAVGEAARTLSRIGDEVLVERMIDDGVAELLIGIRSDPQFGLTLVLASGGILTELLKDAETLLFPIDAETVGSALRRLTVWPLLEGFRGKPAGDVAAVIETVLAVAAFAEARAGTLADLEINPLIVRPTGCGVAVADVLMRLGKEM